MNRTSTQQEPEVHVVDIWTGRHASALRTAQRLTAEEFAARLGTAARTVTKWAQEPDLVPGTEYQRVLDTALSQATAEEQARFRSIYAKQPTDEVSPESVDTPSGPKSISTHQQPNLIEQLNWIDKAAHHELGTSERELAQILEEDTKNDLLNQFKPSTAEIVEALVEYYNKIPDSYTVFKATLDSAHINTGILTRHEWTNLAMPLGVGNDSLELGTPSSHVSLSSSQYSAAIQRIARAFKQRTTLTNAPLYDLTNLSIAEGKLQGVVRTTDFLSYALTLDLLEFELAQQLTQKTARQLHLPLRDQFLPTTNSLVSLDSRLCAGGVAAVFAAKRPPTAKTKGGDYAILVQERSGAVINATGRLAVIPKGCHQPLSDFSDDAQISPTLERELEEELFSREDLDGISGTNKFADPLHLSRLSTPLKWLMKNDASWSMECTGIGLNMINGNFEIACLIAIHDPNWWEQFGGMIESNWESSNLQRYSSLDQSNIASLLTQPNWGNEDLFSLILGLTRLHELNPDYVSLPTLQTS